MVDFDVELFEQRLSNLKDTQDGIQQMSSWCLQQRAHHKKIVSSWLNVLKQVRVEHRLTLFYLANDVIQYSKRKNYEFVESWGTTLQKATTMVRDEKVRNKIFRIFKIWEQREIYSEEYLADLNGLLSMNPVKKQQTQIIDSDEFQNTILISNIRDCVRLGGYTDRSFKKLPKAPTCDTETIKNTLKDRSHSEDVEREIDEYVISLESYIKSLKTEIKSRKSLLHNIDQASTFYTNQRGEVKVVVNAYKNFGNRIKVVKKRLEEITPNLPSPIPSPDINAPSPEQDADIVLPDENHLSTSMFKNQTNGYMSYMDGNLPFDINDFKRESPRSAYEVPSHIATQPIEVISSRSEEKSNSFELTDYYKPVMDSNTYTPSNMPLPVPPVSNYSISQNSVGSYNSEPVNYGADAYDPMTAVYTSDSNYIESTQTNSYDNNMSTMSNMPLMPPPPMPPLLGAQSDDFNSTWDMDMSWTSMDSTAPFNHSMDTPVSPPHFEREGVNTNVSDYVENINEDLVPLQDVDHRQLHIPPAISIKPPSGKEKCRFGDVDHRNLIALTGSPGAPKNMESHRKSLENKRRNSFTKSCDKDFRNTNLVAAFSTQMSPMMDNNKNLSQQIDQDYRQACDTDYRHQNLLEVPKEAAPIPAITAVTPVTTAALTLSSTIPSLQPPPMPPPLEPPNFPKLSEYLSPPLNMIDTSMPPPNFSKNDTKEQGKRKVGSSPIKGTENNPNTQNMDNIIDIVETIDMELSDDDFEDFPEFEGEEISNQSEADIVDAFATDTTAADIDTTIEASDTSTTATTAAAAAATTDTDVADYDSDPPSNLSSPPQQTFKTPLLQTPPEFTSNVNQQQQHQQLSPQQKSWDNLKQSIRTNLTPPNTNSGNMANTWNSPMNNNNNMNNNVPNSWKPPRMPMLNQGMPGFPGIPGNQNFPRGPLFPPQRNFSPQMRPNFRGSPIRPRGGSPYFNNRGRGGMMRGGPPMVPRGNFRGKPWH